MLPQLFVGNFEFEHHLAARGHVPAAAVQRITAEMAAVWLGAARAGDSIWMPRAPEAEHASEMADHGLPAVNILSTEAELAAHLEDSPHRCCPWGWDAQILDWAKTQHLEIDAPPLEVVRHVNSRRFSFDLECEFGLGLPLAAESSDISSLNSALSAFAGKSPWVIKSEFGMSARERILGCGPRLTDAQTAWAGKRFRAGETLIVEPWVSAVAEAGLQFDVPPKSEGLPKCLGVTSLLTDPTGVYRGSRFDRGAANELDWSKAVKAGQIAAERVQDYGYFGPLGIDAMWYDSPECGRRLRPLQDLNARWTMGRISLGFRSLLASGECGVWWHLRCPAKAPDAAADWWREWLRAIPPDVRVLRTSPRTTGQQVTQHATVLLIAAEITSLSAFVMRLNPRN